LRKGKKPRDERYRVHLSVRYQAALDFVMEYAENLSNGGLFVRGAQDLELRQEVDVDVELPGFAKFKVTAEVVHLIDEESAESLSRKPGAGMTIKKSPPGFDMALNSYLKRLGRRKDNTVLASDEQFRNWIEDAGFRALPVPPPSQLSRAVSQSEVPVIGILVSRELEEEYKAAVEKKKIKLRVFGVDFLEELEELLPELDEGL